MIKSQNPLKIIENYEKRSLGIRKEIYDIALYSQGAFKISELWNIPYGYIAEISSSIVGKNEKEKQALDSARGIRTTSF